MKRWVFNLKNVFHKWMMMGMKILLEIWEWLRVFGVLWWKRRELWGFGMFWNWKKRKKRENVGSASMSRHRVIMSRHDLKKFTIYLTHAPTWTINAATCWMLAIYPSSWHATAWYLFSAFVHFPLPLFSNSCFSDPENAKNPRVMPCMIKTYVN